MGRSYTLSDGIRVELSDRKTNRSGYTGAALSPAWTLNPEKPFIAACGNPTDPAIMSQMHAQHRTSWHGGAYADAREAAYVVGMFKDDPISTDSLIEQYGVITDFPADLYDLPEGVSADIARQFIIESASQEKTQRKKADLDPPAAEAFWKRYDKSIMQTLLSKFGRTTVQEAIKTMKISEFEMLFDLKQAA